MQKKLFAAVLGFFLLPAAFAQPAPKIACDRACLENYIDRYHDAMLAKEVKPDLFAKTCRFTENGVELPLGKEGLWHSMSGRGTYKFYIPDVETQQIAYIGTVKEGGPLPGAKTAPGAKPPVATTAAVAIRLKIVDGLITEAEQLVIRPEQSLFGDAPASRFPPAGEAVEKMGAPHPIFTEVIPEAQRHSREELIRIGDYYFVGLQRNDGKGYYPFTEDSVRFENGIVACGLDADGNLIPYACKKQFESGLEGIVTRIRDRRFVAVDRERGIVFAFAFFDHLPINWTWQLAELFKIEGENIRRIEAIFHRCPYGMNSGWSTYEQGMSEEIQSIR
ncbi:MAG TPA: hypothetical protein VLL97_09585 [Acidobacteriota bacterium]|nr:hypothetical protein [Acidobacteriota bacterium]